MPIKSLLRKFSFLTNIRARQRNIYDLLQTFNVHYIKKLITIFSIYQARALKALGLLLADGAPTVGGGKTFCAVSQIFLRKQL